MKFQGLPIMASLFSTLRIPSSLAIPQAIDGPDLAEFSGTNNGTIDHKRL